MSAKGHAIAGWITLLVLVPVVYWIVGMMTERADVTCTRMPFRCSIATSNVFGDTGEVYPVEEMGEGAHVVCVGGECQLRIGLNTVTAWYSDSALLTPTESQINQYLQHGTSPSFETSIDYLQGSGAILVGRYGIPLIFLFI